MSEILDWNDTIETDGQENIILDEAIYCFEITDFERGRFPGSAKIPPCPKATITAVVKTEEGPATVKFDLILCRSLEWKLAAFFRCIGLKKRDEALKMDWTKVVGKRGRAHFRPRGYLTAAGEARVVNDIERFIDHDPSYLGPAAEEAEGAEESWGTF